MAEKTDKPKKAAGRNRAGKTAKPAAKKDARKAGKKATAAKKPSKTAAKKPTAKKGGKRANKAASEGIAVSKEELAGRRIAGGRDVRAYGAPGAAGDQKHYPNSIQALAAANDDGTVASGSAEGQSETAGRIPQSGKRSAADPSARAGENAEGALRPNTLVPTNGIHTTQRRLKRKLYQNRGVMGLIAATLLGIIILGEQTSPPDMTDFEQELAASQAIDTYAGGREAYTPARIIKPKPEGEPKSQPEPLSVAAPSLEDGELVEMERLLARLDMGPSTADGVVDHQTEAAIRLYQEFAGLPVDGAPSRLLLADMREVVKILEDGG